MWLSNEDLWRTHHFRSFCDRHCSVLLNLCNTFTTTDRLKKTTTCQAWSGTTDCLSRGIATVIVLTLFESGLIDFVEKWCIWNEWFFVSCPFLFTILKDFLMWSPTLTYGLLRDSRLSTTWRTVPHMRPVGHSGVYTNEKSSATTYEK